jgi:hypothetical protein
VTEPWASTIDPVSLRDSLVDPDGAERWLAVPASRELPWARVAVLRLLGRTDEAEREAVADLASRRERGAKVAGALTRLAAVRLWQARHDEAVSLLVQALGSGASLSERAYTWQHLATVLDEAGRRSQGLLAARTALALREAAGAPDHLLRTARVSVSTLSGPDVVPLHVDVQVGDGAGRASAREARAVWVGAPGQPVLSMLGWVERDGCLDVVRTVVPGTRRGRGAFRLLLGALPEVVPVSLVVPARDPAMRRMCERVGFEEVGGTHDGIGHVGGDVHLHREPEPFPVPAPRSPARVGTRAWFSRR